MSGAKVVGVVASEEDWALLEGDDALWGEDPFAAPAEGQPSEDTVLGEDDLLDARQELGRVSRKIAGQYVEVMASFAARAFAGSASSAMVEQVEAAIDALSRLARAAGDGVQRELLDEARAVIGPATRGPRNGRDRQAALRELREWIPRYAKHLEADDAARLLRLVEWSDASSPLMDELASIKGIGPKRLGRLYAAGLYTVEVVASADPVEMAEVTGLPKKLARKVVEKTHHFAVEERRRCLREVREQAMRLRSILRSTTADDPELLSLAAQALREVQTTIESMNQDCSSSAYCGGASPAAAVPLRRGLGAPCLEHASLAPSSSARLATAIRRLVTASDEQSGMNGDDS